MAFSVNLRGEEGQKNFFQAIDAERKGRNPFFRQFTQRERAEMAFSVKPRGEEGRKWKKKIDSAEKKDIIELYSQSKRR